MIKSANKAFTLIELSIVLVIIGLIAGGVLVGGDLIKGAQLRSVIADTEKYITAATTFRAKYNCLPGDCLHATKFWETHASCPNGSSALSDTQTCNGNGNKRIEKSAPYEHARAFQHLALAGLIAGTYPVGGIVGNQWTSQANYPELDMPNVQISFRYFGTYYNNAYLSDGYYGNGAHLGRNDGNSVNTDLTVFTTFDAKAIDSKTDDGMPNTGQTRGVIYHLSADTGANCVTGGSRGAPDNDYYLDYTGANACSVVMKNVF